jgi:2-polyprenyl-3-methyl-5-hydroxy-6-metoxy-1,4-benzoquinol methylase
LNILCSICKKKTIGYFSNKFDDRYGYKQLFDIFHCNKCRHKFLIHNFKTNDLKDLYSNYYPRSNFSISDYKPLQLAKNKFLAWFNGENGAHQYVAQNVKVLDIGCGFGGSIGYHLKRGCDAYGVEADSNIKKIIDHYGFNIKNGLFSYKDYKKNSFDYVTLDQVLEHMVDPVHTLKDISKILKPTGVLVINIPNSKSWGARLFKSKWIHWHIPYHLQHFSKQSIQLAAKQAEFNIFKIKTFTSSEWLYYQWMSLVAYPKYGNKSVFWENKVRQMSKFSLKFWCFVFLKLLHKTKVNHILTRIFDSLGMGDNLVVILTKKNNVIHTSSSS